MAKRALCVGINDYPYTDDDDLRGCVNDAKAWATLLREHYDFAKTDITILTDAKARKKDVKGGLKKLIASGKKGDVLVFMNASHGTNDIDTGNDEPDGFDEALCPYDVDSNLLLDDEIRELIAGLKAGVTFYMISDSCHSGSVTRDVRRAHDVPDTRRSRYLSPQIRGKTGSPNPARRAAERRRKVRGDEEAMVELLLTGCNATQSSWDDLFGDTFHGALSYYALETIRARDYSLTWRELHAEVSRKLTKNQFEQSPQLEGPKALKDRPIFT